MGFNYPTPPAYFGGAQPLTAIKLTPQPIAATNPPFEQVTTTMLLAMIAKSWAASPRPQQPEINLTPSFTPDNPPLGDNARRVQILAITAQTWTTWPLQPQRTIPKRQITNNPTQSSNTVIRKQWFRSQ